MKNITLVQTIIALAVVLFAIQTVSSLVTFSRLNIMGHHIEQIEETFIPVTKVVSLVTEHQLIQEVDYERAFRLALESQIKPEVMEHFHEVVEAYNKLTPKIDGELKEALGLINSSLSNISEPETKKQLLKIQQDLNWIKQHHDDWVKHVDHALVLLAQKEFSQAIDLSDGIEAEAISLVKKVASTLVTIEEFTEEAIHEIKVEEASILNVGIIILVISLVSAIVATRFVTGNLKKDMAEFKLAISKISDGDLFHNSTSRISQEFGIDQMRDNLRAILLLVEDSANEMLAASQELASVSNQVSKATDQQVQEVELISSAMTEMEATSEEVARHAENTQNSTRDVTQKALIGRDATNNAIKLIQQLTNSLEQSGDSIKELETHSNQISSILDVIKSIAEQTNLLALNAAIEAARAGEQGRGFAVVADEVRNLAKRTQESTIEIESMIELFTRGTTEAVQSMSQCAIHGEASQKATDDTNHSIEDIQHAVEEINSMNSQIATAAEQQSCTSQELSRNTMKVSELTNENASSVARVSSASEQLEQVSLQLKDKLAQFVLK